MLGKEQVQGWKDNVYIFIEVKLPLWPQFYVKETSCPALQGNFESLQEAKIARRREKEAPKFLDVPGETILKLECIFNHMSTKIVVWGQNGLGT